MQELRLLTISGADISPKPGVIEAFQSSLRGILLHRQDDGYDEARAVHNGMIDHHPAMIVRCAGVADVMTTVKFCADHNLLFSVRGGGHNVAGLAVCDGGVMIDLSAMNTVHVDPQAQSARAEGGATWGDFDHEAQAFGLATTGGVARPTGIGGFTLGGGHGYLMRRYGLACDNLISADIVTANGQLVTASAAQNEDLFWGIRGGGGNFGVATSFQFRLHPVDQVLGGLLIYPFEKTRELGRLFRDIPAGAPDELGAIIAIATHPELGRIVVALVCYTGPIDEGERLLKPFRQIKPILADQVTACPYGAVQSIAENFNPRGMRNYWKSSFLRELGDDVLDLIVERYSTVPAPHDHIVFEAFGGAVARVPRDATAYDHRAWPLDFIVVGMWDQPAGDERNIGWVRETWQAMQPYSAGAVYVNYMDRQTDEGQERLKSAYGPEKYERLVALKGKYDPTNLFRLNQNIKPQAVSHD